MHLSTYLCVNDITQTQLARACGVSVNSANRWVNRQHVPAPEMMIRIYVWTNGQVRPDDFYDLPDLPAADASPLRSVDGRSSANPSPVKPTPLEKAIGAAA